MNSKKFIEQLTELATDKQRLGYEKMVNLKPANKKLGVGMGKVFALAKEHIDMPKAQFRNLGKQAK